MGTSIISIKVSIDGDYLKLSLLARSDNKLALWATVAAKAKAWGMVY